MEKTNDLIAATIVADSINKQGDRITSMMLNYPRIIHSEFMTHRMLSKNSASSRAIPFKKMIRMVQEHPFVPTRWMKEHSGMQGKEYYTDPIEIGHCIKAWMDARDSAIKAATDLNRLKVSKQICNRLLEPFMMHTCLITGTDWQNFFALRAHEDAEIHIQELAYKMLDEYNKSTPELLQPGEWHIPFGKTFDKVRLYTQIEADYGIYDSVIAFNEERYASDIQLYKVMISTARCARTSYLNNEGTDDYMKDIELHDRLLKQQPIHASPAEHCAQAMTDIEWSAHRICTLGNETIISDHGRLRNFKGWKQYRTMLPHDTAVDERVNKK
jgi:thymidylate synthase ThyX